MHAANITAAAMPGARFCLVHESQNLADLVSNDGFTDVNSSRSIDSIVLEFIGFLCIVTECPPISSRMPLAGTSGGALADG